jgi:hypothetical protein
MKTYCGRYKPKNLCGPHLVFVTDLAGSYDLNPVPSQALMNHSPDGFSWGYSGSGPAQLALAILYDYTGDSERSLDLYQEFKRDFVSRWPEEKSWVLTANEIEDWLSKHPVRH